MSKEKSKIPPMPKGPMGHGRMSTGEKPKNFLKTIFKLVKYSKSSLPAIILAMLFAVAAIILTLYVPNITGDATDKLFEGVMQKQIYSGLSEPVNQGAFSNLEITSMQSLAAYVEKKTGINQRDITLRDIMLLPEDDPLLQAFNELSIQGGHDLQGSINKLPERYLEPVMRLNIYYMPQIDIDAILKLLLLMCILIVISGGLSFIQSFILAGVAQKISFRLRRDIDLKINKLPLKFYDTTTNGEILSYLTNDVDSISTTLNQSLSQLATSLTTIVGVLVMMIRISLLLTGISIIIVPLCGILMMLVVKFSQKHFRNQQRYLGQANGHIEEMYGGHKVITLYNGQQDSKDKFEVLNSKLAKASHKSQFLSGLMNPIMIFLGNVGYVIVCVIGGMLSIGQISIGKAISIGDIQAFIQYMRRFNQPIGQLANIVNTLQSTAAAGERVFNFLEAEEEKETGTLSPQNVIGNVDFENVRFGYNPDKIIIKDFSAHIKNGQRIAIVGPTGAGKTTMVKLLMRYYDIISGRILLDGIDISTYKRSELRKEFGMVLQDTWLFNGTIMENLRYGKLDSSDDDVIKASKIACADDFIRQLPGGYNFVINEEADNISQGQKQLLTIARAILNDPKVLVLDEATSSVDTRTELLIQNAMERLMEGRTSFIIAHRLSTIRDANLILVMRDGDIIEQGSHKELMEKQGFYEQLYNSQFEEA